MAGFQDTGQFTMSFDLSQGAQIPLSGSAVRGQTGITAALASVAFRDGSPDAICEASDKSSVTKPKISLLEPNLGEAFTRALEKRMLAEDRKPLVQSFGVDPQTVVEHALAAKRLRRQRDAQLTLIMAVCGLLFLPGVLIWLGLFQLRRTFAGAQDRRAGVLGMLALGVVAVLVVLLLYRAPVSGPLRFYLWAALPAPVLGWLWAQRVAERTAQGLRAQWSGLLSGGSAGAKIPEAVPQNPNDKDAERLRTALAKITEEQASNLIHYAGPEGILGMGVRWCQWTLAEELQPADPQRDIDPFRAWDVVRAIHDQLRMLERGPLHTGGFPTPPSLVHWVVRHVGEGAEAVSRPEGPAADGYRFTNIEVQRICNEQHIDSGDRHYLGAQFVLWDGALVVTMMIQVTVLHRIMRIEVTGHLLGPVHGFFFKGPDSKTRKVRHPVKFWTLVERPAPLVDAKEVVRLAARAPLTWRPAKLDELGGKLSLPEPFGLRHTWAGKPWRHRFMADDALRIPAPVLVVVYETAIRVLAEHGVDTSGFTAKAAGLRGAVQSVSPGTPDEYGV